MRALLEDRQTLSRQVVDFDSTADDMESEIQGLLKGNEYIDVEQILDGVYSYSIEDGIGKIYIASNYPITKKSSQVLIVEPIDYYMYSLVQRPY